MFDAQLMQTESDGSSVSVHGPWMLRGGDYGIFTLEVVEGTLQATLSSLTVHIFHKNAEDTGDGSQVSGTTLSLSGAGTDSGKYGGLKEMVRYKFTVGAAGSEDQRWALFRMLSPVWFDAVGV